MSESTSLVRVKSLMETPAVRDRFEQMLGKKAPAFLSSILSAMSANPDLQSAEPMSIIQSAAVAASLDLVVNPSLGLAHIVPYSGKATFQMGWKGFVQLAQRSGQYRTMNATVIKEGQLKHRDPFTGEIELQEEATSDEVVGYLFYFKLLNGFEKYGYMTKEACHAHGKKYSATYRKNKGRWVEDFDAMALKTVVKLTLSKWGPLSTAMQTAIERDGSDDEGGYPDNPSEPPSEEPSAGESEKKKGSRVAGVVGVEGEGEEGDVPL